MPLCTSDVRITGDESISDRRNCPGKKSREKTLLVLAFRSNTPAWSAGVPRAPPWLALDVWCCEDAQSVRKRRNSKRVFRQSPTPIRSEACRRKQINHLIFGVKLKHISWPCPRSFSHSHKRSYTNSVTSWSWTRTHLWVLPTFTSGQWQVSATSPFLCKQQVWQVIEDKAVEWHLEFRTNTSRGLAHLRFQLLTSQLSASTTTPIQQSENWICFSLAYLRNPTWN